MGLTLLLCACNKGNTAAKKEESNATREEMAIQCMHAVIQAETPEELAKFVVSCDEETAQEIIDTFPKSEPTITMDYKDTYQVYHVFLCDVTYADDDLHPNGAVLMKPDKTGNGYRLCVLGEDLEGFQKHYRCKTCNGTGNITTGSRIACGICSGTGVQHITQFDPITGGMTQTTVGCGGCGGSGHIASGASVACSACGGIGLDF